MLPLVESATRSNSLSNAVSRSSRKRGVYAFYQRSFRPKRSKNQFLQGSIGYVKDRRIGYLKINLLDNQFSNWEFFNWRKFILSPPPQRMKTLDRDVCNVIHVKQRWQRNISTYSLPLLNIIENRKDSEERREGGGKREREREEKRNVYERGGNAIKSVTVYSEARYNRGEWRT